ncbi:homeobox-leucine zipper protein REVOLUTA-like [Malania oleifera]|uniref:homeobox-leucine zipper protein REVOLUTA-like n=1 Tax=Malania oleifera TaxID=397392 RepID=UPI0025ADC6AC|nr:homeobox-leucine zipper protein REVOLUTA-like [Malania oleifera]XP_057979608.1 homeobox-leucine zipper protein REVOLUTA-like [Malania oleifera]XP_057979610.1 homeobox-leucine zipper protein REVOLUTA-like [Malania oleifera]XP_057979611.1 homeobox-leucine zipper protein REVOLUTA-like [Malania oleifera]XP_057979612.1 homeobox-leucine zipper protein REVOLUTA-like [Malania oleifera]
MADPPAAHGDSSCSSGGGCGGGGGGGGSRKRPAEVGKYARYTPEQIAVLEKLYAECPKPSNARRLALIQDYPIFSNVDSRQIKVWFQNHRCREKQKNETTQLQTVNKRLTANNKLLMEENDRLQSQVSQLVYENVCMRQQLHHEPVAAALASCESRIATPRHSLVSANNSTGLLSIAEEAKGRFLTKATGTAVDWIQIPGMKPGPVSVGILGISGGCSGVGARASCLVSLEPKQIADILKDRPSWLRDCRKQEVFASFPAGNRGTIELIYIQICAPSTLAPARDFWTLRYSTSLEDGGVVVCERSTSGSGVGPNPPATLEFVRARMLPSGYLIRPCEGGGSIVRIVDHLDLEARSVPEVLQPLYESSQHVAEKMTVPALHHLREMAEGLSSEVTHAMAKQAAVLRSFRQQLSRDFNDAINGFHDDGWSLLTSDATENVMISINSTKELSSLGSSIDASSLPIRVLCVKTSILLHNIEPPLLIRFMRERRSDWADCSVDAYSAASLKTGSFALLGLSPTQFYGNQTIMPLGQTYQNEMLEIVQLEHRGVSQEEGVLFRNIRLLQICSGVDDSVVETCSELVFAPVNDMFPDEAPLISSGFRILRLDLRTSDRQDMLAQQRLDPASSLEEQATSGQTAGSTTSSDTSRSLLTIAFQFPFESHAQENVLTMAQQYIRNVVSSVHRIATAIVPPGLSPHAAPKLTPCSPETLTLAYWICHSYRVHLGAELLSPNCLAGGDPILKLLWHHPNAVVCCSLKLLPGFVFANQAGLNMLETSLLTLKGITLHKIFDDSGWKAVCAVIPKIMEQGFAFLPGGIIVSTMGHHVAYEQVVAWQVLRQDGALHCLAFAFINWSFL